MGGEERRRWSGGEWEWRVGKWGKWARLVGTMIDWGGHGREKAAAP